MSSEAPQPEGYRATPIGGPRLRSDIVDVYIFRRAPNAIEFLQLLRAGEPLIHTWQPIMGHVEPGETASQTAVRELKEEVALAHDSPACLAFWSLEQVHPYYVAAIDCIVLSPRFAVEVAPGWEPRINAEHTAARWVSDSGSFMWPGQKKSIEEINAEIVNPRSLSRTALLIRMDQPPRK
ncbi:MAG: NUDIX domain-containing protein [Phycisphaerae bacterium]|nr:NUDIX domain-containing protein [Phycisphaerae bacterium]